MNLSSRRRFLMLAPAAAPALWTVAARPDPAHGAGTAPFYPPVRRATPIVFPRDHGAHPPWRTEWWYLTGWLERLDGPHRGAPAGVQVTFFRSRTRHDPADPSRFAPTQLLLAHAALALPEEARLTHAQRAARAGFGLAEFSVEDTAVSIGDWSLERGRDDRYRARVRDERLALDLEFVPGAPPVLQGENGYSRKGPLETQASCYYSRPQLRVSGRITAGGEHAAVRGVAWLDHEWSSELLDPSADGWDWTGLNLDDGSALMAFRIRRRDGSPLWSQARWVDGRGRALRPDPQPVFTARRRWTSPRTGARYPVAMTLAAGTRTLTLEPLFDDQELDARASAGAVYWEGAVRALEAGRPVGRGYLELTGYAGALRL